MKTSNQEILLSIQGLNAVYETRLGDVDALSDINLDIYKGEVLGLVGESGCGKSTLGRSILRMIAEPGKINSGQMIFDGVDLMSLSQEAMNKIRGDRISMIFQDPMTSLNPVQRIDEHIVETIQTHEKQTKKDEAKGRAAALTDRLGISTNRLEDYPHQLSGGMRQRVMISLGLVLNADLIIADEATTSLDVIVEAKLVDELMDIRREFGLSILVITHNIALVAQIVDRLAVMYAGRIVEVGSVYDVFDHPKHPYTQGLLQSIPTIRLNVREELYKMPGEPPNLTHPPSGCRFHPRCPRAMPICARIKPDLVDVQDGWMVHCWLFQDHPEKEALNAEGAS